LDGREHTGEPLLLIRREDGVLTAETPFLKLLEVNGGPVPQSDLPATWWLVPGRP
jgi:hypothetical protein